MTDTVDVATRSRIMSRIRGRDTGPEMCVRRALTALGYRYRVNVRGLPGTPDLLFPRRRKVVRINGDFWHWHSCKAKIPESNQDFWIPKLEANIARDARNRRRLNRMGYSVITVWECQINKDLAGVARRLARLLGPPRQEAE